MEPKKRVNELRGEDTVKGWCWLAMMKVTMSGEYWLMLANVPRFNNSNPFYEGV